MINFDQPSIIKFLEFWRCQRRFLSGAGVSHNTGNARGTVLGHQTPLAPGGADGGIAVGRARRRPRECRRRGSGRYAPSG